MERLTKVGISIITTCMLYIIMFFVSYYMHDFFYKDVCCIGPSLSQVDDSTSMERIQNNTYRICNIVAEGVKDYFLKFIYFLLKQIGIQYNILNIFSLDAIMNKIYNGKNILLNRLMHQSSDLLNSDVIAKTTIILPLYEEKEDRCYWVIQLGALKNAKKVFEIVDKLKSNNYLVYISPNCPQNGEIIRIFIGPDSSKENLEYLLDDLYHLSGLFGKIILLSESKKRVD